MLECHFEVAAKHGLGGGGRNVYLATPRLYVVDKDRGTNISVDKTSRRK